jgi:hypothetical protein
VPHDREARTREERPFSGHSRGNTEPRTYREQGERKKPSEQKKKGKPKKTEKRQHTEQKPEREHEPNKDYTERGIAFTIAFVPVDNKKTRKQAGGKEEEKLGREGRVKEKQNRGEKAVALLLG